MRLTNESRKIILNRLIAHRFDKQRDALLEREYALANECYDTVFDPKTRALLSELPHGWTPRRTVYTGRVAGCWVDLSFGEDKPWPCSSNVESLTHNDPVTQKVLDFINDRKDHATAREAAANAIKGTLSSYGTLARLVEAWPEIEPFCYGLGPVRKNLPAIQTDKLNALLDLPVGEENART